MFKWLLNPAISLGRPVVSFLLNWLRINFQVSIKNKNKPLPRPGCSAERMGYQWIQGGFKSSPWFPWSPKWSQDSPQPACTRSSPRWLFPPALSALLSSSSFPSRFLPSPSACAAEPPQISSGSCPGTGSFVHLTANKPGAQSYWQQGGSAGLGTSSHTPEGSKENKVVFLSSQTSLNDFISSFRVWNLYGVVSSHKK